MESKIDFIHENTSRALIKMFAPLFMAMMLTMIYSMVDSFWVLFLYMQFTSVFRAFGDPGFQMKGMILTAVFNAAADPLLIHVWGLVGAAVATVISEFLCLAYACFHHRKMRIFTIDFGAMKTEYGKEMASLCIPTSVQAIMPALSSAIMISLIAPFGLIAIAGYGVARNLELIMFMPTTGMCMALLLLYYIVIRIPAAVLLRGSMGLDGIWAAFLISHILAVWIAVIMTMGCKTELIEKPTVHPS